MAAEPEAGTHGPGEAIGSHASDSRPVVPILHVVTDDGILTQMDFVVRASTVMIASGARGALHLRTRFMPARRLLAIAESLVKVQEDTGAWLVINDRADVAAISHARGLQLTSHSMSVSDARIALSQPGTGAGAGVALGASVHSPQEAERATAEGAGWLIAGHIFTTGSHPDVPGRGIDFLREVKRASTLPVIAIGGVTPERVNEVRAAGADGVAVIRGVWRARDAERAVTEYLSAYDAHDRGIE